MKPLNIIGMGYIGLPTALMFAAHGQEVVGTDLKSDLIDSLRDGILDSNEDGMYDLFLKAKELNRIDFSTNYIKTNKYLIAVPTPYLKESKKIDPQFVKEAIKEVLRNCEDETIIIIESTIAPGTIYDEIYPLVNQYKGNKKVSLVHAPERIIPGRMVYELLNNSRIIGSDDTSIGESVKTLYKTFCRGEICLTDIKTAELCKVIENSFRDVNIAFANEIAKICEKENLDVNKVINIANKHPRVNIMKPGPGVGGHCISVDPWFLVGKYNPITKLIESAREVNNSMPQFVFEKVKKIMKCNNINDFNKVGLYGLSYKENVDDIRESPTLQLIEVLESNNINNIKVYDPYVKSNCVENQYHDFERFIDEIEVIIIMVAHDEIKGKQALLKDKIVYDTRDCISCGKIIYKL